MSNGKDNQGVELFRAGRGQGDSETSDDESLNVNVPSVIEEDDEDEADIDIDLDLTIADINRAFDPRTPSLLKLRDKITFVLGVVNVFTLAFLVHGFPWVMPWFYIVKAPILLSIRTYTYFKDKFQYFLIDFCYWANLLVLVHIIFFPTNKRLFTVAYSVTHGPLIWAVGLFKNALVFHSLDKTISAFIHVSPYMVCYTIRWFHDSYPGHTRFDVCHPDDQDCASFIWTAVIPLLFYICWMICYGIVITVIFPIPNESYLTSYRYLTRKRGPLYFIRSMPFGWLIYAVSNVLVTFLFFCPVILIYRSQVFDFLYGAFFCTVAVWNGAGYYIEVFSKKYDDHILKELKHNSK